MFQQPITFDKLIRWIGGGLLVITLLYLLKLLGPVLLPFLIALIIAYFLNPGVLFFERVLLKRLKIKSRGLAVTLTLFSIGLLMTIFSIIFVPMITKEAKHMGHLLSIYVHDAHIDEWLPESISTELKHFAGSEEIKEMITLENGGKIVEKVVPGVFNFFSGSMKVLMGLLGLVVILLYLVFIMMDYNKITDGAPGLIPEKYRDKVMILFRDLRDGMNKYFRAQALKAAIIGVLFAIGFSIAGIPMGFLLGIGFGVLNMVPYLQLVGIGPALFCALLKALDSGQPVWIPILSVIIVMVVIQIIEEVILTPKIMGEVTGLNPAIIMLSLSIWGSLLGMVGLIIALPITSLLLSYYQRFLKHEKVLKS